MGTVVLFEWPEANMQNGKPTVFVVTPCGWDVKLGQVGSMTYLFTNRAVI